MYPSNAELIKTGKGLAQSLTLWQTIKQIDYVAPMKIGLDEMADRIGVVIDQS